ncbi:hypothetical protein P7H22_11870 [Paenibacillus larvae]|nr:hypothetical protein [Paenibacillus larvae]MDT2240913.1 hypothetical protein [Paenibacillus larvae]
MLEVIQAAMAVIALVIAGDRSRYILNITQLSFRLSAGGRASRLSSRSQMIQMVILS